MESNQRRTFIAEIVPPPGQHAAAWWFAFLGDKLLVHLDGSSCRLPLLASLEELKVIPTRQHYLGHLEHHPCFAVELAEGTPLPSGMAFKGLREVYGCLEEDLFWIAARGVQIVDWDRTHQFCGRCGAPTKMRVAERAKECPKCGLLHFPRLAPAIIVLVERGKELLLARACRFPPGRYSVIAGFVEPGETLEETVRREVREETGITIKNICYFASQSWPFPHSLMIGFTATYQSGEVAPQDPEIADAGWFTPDNLPNLPTKMSIARKLVDWFLEKHSKRTT